MYMILCMCIHSLCAILCCGTFGEFSLLWSESLSGAFWQTPGRLPWACYCGAASVWPPSIPTIQAWVGKCCSDGRPFGRSSSLHRGTLELCQSDHHVRPPPQLKPFSPGLSVEGRPALGRVLVVLNVFHSRRMEAPGGPSVGPLKQQRDRISLFYIVNKFVKISY